MIFRYCSHSEENCSSSEFEYNGSKRWRIKGSAKTSKDSINDFPPFINSIRLLYIPMGLIVKKKISSIR